MDNGEELVFRDGKFVVPEYLAILMGEIDTTRYRYRDAVELVNQGALRQHLDKAQQSTIKRHFDEQVRSDGNPR